MRHKTIVRDKHHLLVCFRCTALTVRIRLQFSHRSSSERCQYFNSTSMCIAVHNKIWNDQLISDSETIPDKLHIGVRHSEGMFLDNFKSQLFNLHELIALGLLCVLQYNKRHK